MTSARMQQRRDTGSNWASVNPVLAAGEIGVDTDTGALKVGDGSSTWTQLRGFLPGPVDYAETIRTAGDLSFNTIGWQNVSTTLDVTVAARAGDLVAFSPQFSCGNTANQFAFDVFNVTSSYYWASGTVTPVTNGQAGWLAAASAQRGIAGQAFYRVQSLDIVSGLLTMRLRVNPSTTTSRTISATATTPAKVSAVNYGQLL